MQQIKEEKQKNRNRNNNDFEMILTCLLLQTDRQHRVICIKILNFFKEKVYVGVYGTHCSKPVGHLYHMARDFMLLQLKYKARQRRRKLVLRHKDFSPKKPKKIFTK